MANFQKEPDKQISKFKFETHPCTILAESIFKFTQLTQQQHYLTYSFLNFDSFMIFSIKQRILMRHLSLDYGPVTTHLISEVQIVSELHRDWRSVKQRVQ